MKTVKPLMLCAVMLMASAIYADTSEEGKKISFDQSKGNCLACHSIRGGEMSGNIAPPIVAMKLRYPDKKKLREQIWDPMVKNKNSMMPPFGKHGILTEEEIDKVIEFIYEL